MALHSWELPERDWEAPDGFGDEWASDFEDEGPDYGQMTHEMGAEHLCEFIVILKLSGAIAAKSARLLCFWASKAGVTGPVSKLAMPPNRQSGKYSNNFDKAEGHPREDGFLYIDAPVHRRCDCARVSMKMPVSPPRALVFGVGAAQGDVARRLGVFGAAAVLSGSQSLSAGSCQRVGVAIQHLPRRRPVYPRGFGAGHMAHLPHRVPAILAVLFAEIRALHMRLPGLVQFVAIVYYGPLELPASQEGAKRKLRAMWRDVAT